MSWVPFALAVFLLGALCSGPVWLAIDAAEIRRRRDLKKLARRD